MRVVALQSASGYDGLTTDDGAANGEITLLGTLGLVVFLALVGGVAGLVYAAVRPALPERRRPLVWGVLTGLVVGSMVIHADGVDYAVLGSRWVSVAMFGAVSAGYGALAAHVAERLLRPDGWSRRTTTVRAGVPFLALLPGLTLVPIGLALGGVAAARATGLLGRIPRGAVVVVVRIALGIVAVASAVDLARTLSDLA